MRRLPIFNLLSWLLIPASMSMADILNVPADYRDIASAVATAAANDTVLIQPGRYEETLRIRSNVTIASLYITSGVSSYADSTFIAGDGENSVIEITGNYAPVFSGLTITNGGASQGGAFYLRFGANPRITRCRITGNSSGIFCIDRSNPTIDNCRISDNESRIGGDGIYCRDSSNPTILNSIISGNSGAGIYCLNNSSPIIDGCIIERNASKGIHLVDSRPNISDCIIRDNTSETVGGLYFRSRSDAELTDCTISGNTGTAFGGIACYQSSPSFARCNIEENTGNLIGGIRSGVGSNPFFYDCRIRGNIGLNQWGAVRCDESNPEFVDCIINDNISGTGCGGISLNESNVMFLRCLIFDNASLGDGGAVFSTRSNVLFQNSNIINNQCEEDGSAFYVDGGGLLSVVNSIIRGNSEPAVFLNSWGNDFENRARFSIEYSDVDFERADIESRGLTEIFYSGSNINEDPLFFNPGEHDFNLTVDSPCIDTGSPFTPLDPDGTISDIGAFFYRQPNILVMPDNLEFEPIRIGSLDSLSFIVSNIGLRSLTVDTIYILPGGNLFTLGTAEVTFELEENTLRRFWVRYAPWETGKHYATVIIESNDRDEGWSEIVVFGKALAVSLEDETQPMEFALKSVFPNPFNDMATARFSLPSPATIDFEINDVHGRLAGALPSVSAGPGLHELTISAAHLPSGYYLLRMKSRKDESTCIFQVLK